MIGRRGFITGLVSFVAAPAIVRVRSIMPVKVMPVAHPNLTATEVQALMDAMLDMAQRRICPVNFIDTDMAMRTFFDGIGIRQEMVRIR
jgi:hypothetical protein